MRGPVTTFCRLGSEQKRFHYWRQLRTVSVSFQSWACLALVMSLFCSPVLELTPMSSCIAMLTSAQAGMDSSHIKRCCSVIPHPLVKPPLIFMLLINTCSIMRSEERPAHRCHFSLHGDPLQIIFGCQVVEIGDWTSAIDIPSQILCGGCGLILPVRVPFLK